MSEIPGAGATPDEERYIRRVFWQLESVERFAKWFYIGIFALICLWSLVGPLRGVSPSSIVQKMLLGLGVSLVVMAAATLIGGFLGLLFGIPKQLQRDGYGSPLVRGRDGAPPETRTGKRLYLTNTSFEEISDWLTKIVVGLGLVQFGNILAYIYWCSLYAAAYVVGTGINDIGALPKNYDTALGIPFFYALIIAGLLGGCFFVYIETRTRLTLLFLGIEDRLDYTAREDARASYMQPVINPAADVPPTSRAVPLQPTTAAPTKEDKRLALKSKSVLETPMELAGWALAQARSGNLQAAEDALREALQQDPANGEILFRLAEVRRLLGDLPRWCQTLIEASSKMEDVEKLRNPLRQATVGALYHRPPEGYTQAIALTDVYIGLFGNTDPMVLLWRAAAFGQKFAAEKDRVPKKEREAIRARALDAIMNLLAIDPKEAAGARRLLKQLYDPARFGGPPGDNDLEVFKGDDEFERIIAPL